MFLYGFFLSFASGVPAFFEKHPAKKFRGQNLLVFRTLTAKLGTMGVVMATISLLLTATLMAEGTGLVFWGLFDGRAAQEGAFDLYIASEYGIDEEYLDYVAEHIPVEEAVLYPVYRGEEDALLDYIGEHTGYEYFSKVISVMGLHDYNAVRRIAGLREAELAKGQYLIHCMASLEHVLKGYGRQVTVGGVALDFGGVYSEPLMQQQWEHGNGEGHVLVVPDALARELTVHHWAYAAKTREAVEENVFAGLGPVRERVAEKSQEEKSQGNGNGNGESENGPKEDDAISWLRYDSIHARAQAEAEAASMTTMTVFPLCFLSLALVMTTATILAIWQLSESARYRQQFALLKKLGMEFSEMEKALRLQLAVYYAMPAVPAVLIGVPFIWNLCGATEPGVLSGASSPAAIMGISLGMFFLVYVIYVVVAYVSLRRDVLPE